MVACADKRSTHEDGGACGCWVTLGDVLDLRPSAIEGALGQDVAQRTESVVIGPPVA